MTTIPEGWEIPCSDRPHPSFWKTVVTSPEWKAWEKEVGRRMSRLCKIDKDRAVEEAKCRLRGLPEPTWPNPKIGNVWDIDECQQCGYISPEHFYDFVKFLRTAKAKRARNHAKAVA